MRYTRSDDGVRVACVWVHFYGAPETKTLSPIENTAAQHTTLITTYLQV